MADSAKVIAFNTGRLYTTAGQRIAATLIDSGLLFVDIDRYIEYFLPLAKLPAGFELTPRDVLHAYDYQSRDMSSLEPFRHPEVMAALRTAAREVK